MLGMYTLLSMDSYPTIFQDIVLDNPYYLIFFIPYVALNLFFLLFIPVPVIFENYKKQCAIIILEDDLIAQKALTFAFFTIASSSSSKHTEDFLTKDQFFDLINQCKQGGEGLYVTPPPPIDYDGIGLRDKID